MSVASSKYLATKAKIEEKKKKAKSRLSEASKKTSASAAKKAENKTTTSKSSSTPAKKTQYTPEQIQNGISNLFTNYIQKRLEQEPDNAYLKAWNEWNAHENAVNNAAAANSNDTRYKLTGAEDLKKSGAFAQTQKALQGSIQAQQYWGAEDTDYPHKSLIPGWQERTKEGIANANTENALNWTRSGNLMYINQQKKYIDQLKKEGYEGKNIFGKEKYSNQEEIDAAQATLEQMEGLMKLYGMEDIYSGHSRNSLADYSRDALNDDLMTVLYKAQGYEADADEYNAAVKRVRDFIGGANTDVVAAAEADPSGKWVDSFLNVYDQRKDTLDKYIAKNSNLAGTDYEFGAGEYLDYLNSYDREQKRKEQEAALGNQLASEADALATAAKGMEGYSELSQYVPSKDRWEGTNWNSMAIDQTFYMPGEDNRSIDWDTAREEAKYAFLNDYIGAIHNGDAQSASTMENAVGFMPGVADYNLPALHYTTPEQRETIFAYFNSRDYKALEEFLGKINYDISKRYTEEWEKEYAEGLEGNVGKQILANVDSFGNDLLAGLGGAAFTVNQLLNDAGIPLGNQDYNHAYNPAFMFQRKSDIATNALAQSIAEATPYLNIGGINLASAAYTGVKSAVGSLLATTVAGPVGGLALLSGGASGRELQERMEAGDPNAAFYSAGVGAIEAIFENIGLEAIFSKKMTNALFGNAAEEMGTELGNMLWDVVVNGDNNQTQRLIDQYEVMGFTDRSEFLAAIDQARNVANAAISGMFGGAIAAPGAAAEYAANVKTGRQLNGSDEALVNIASGMTDLSPEAQKIIQSMQQNTQLAKAEAEPIIADKGEAKPAKGAGIEAQPIEGKTSAQTPDVDAQPIAAEAKAKGDKAVKEAAKTPVKGTAKEAKPVKISNAQRGMVYRAVMQKLDQKAQAALRDRISFDVSDELKRRGVGAESARGLAESILRIQDGSSTLEDVEAIKGNEAARTVLLDWTAKVVAEDEAMGRVNELAGLTQKGSKEIAEDILSADDAKETPESMLDDAPVTVEGIASIADDGTVMVNVVDADGNTQEVAAEDVAFGTNDTGTAVMAKVASTLGRNADIMLSNIEDGQNEAEYATAFETAMNYGRDGRNLNRVKSSDALSNLTESQINIAYTLGRDTRIQNTRMVRKNASGISVGNVDVSDINMSTLNKHQRASVNAVGRLAKAIGFNVRFVESVANADGKYTTENGSWDSKTMTMTLDIHAGSNYASDSNYAMMHTAGHELTHYIKDFADAGLWNEYQDFVIGHLSQKMNEADLENDIQRHMEQNPKLTREGAIEEIVADASGDALLNLSEADIRQMAETNPSLIERVKSFFEKWISNIKKFISEAYKGTEAKTAEAKAMLDAVDEMSAKWNKLLVNASQNKNVTSETTAKKADAQPVKYSTRDFEQANKTAEDGFDAWCRSVESMSDAEYREAKQSTPLIMVSEETPAILQKYGAKDRRMLIRLDALYLAIRADGAQEGHYHHLGAKNMAKLIEQLENPDAILTSDDGRLKALVRVDTKRGQALASIELETIKDYGGKYEAFNLVVTAFDYEKRYLKGLFARRDAKVLYKKETLSQVNPQLHEWLEIFNESVPAESVPQDEENVKFSMRTPVESTKNLIAVHNLNEDKLNKALELGGFPMPSIAITKADIGHQGFGSISLVFGEETIDPQKNKKNTVYSADAWTPTFPRVEYEADSKVESRIRKKLNDLLVGIDDYYSRRISHYAVNLSDALTRYGGLDGLIENAMRDDGIKAAYLADHGQRVEVEMVPKAPSYNLNAVDLYQAIVDGYDGDFTDFYGKNGRYFMDNYGEENIRNVFIQDAINNGISEADAEAVYSNAKLGTLWHEVTKAIRWHKAENGEQVTEYEKDYGKTSRKMNESIDKADFEKWVRELYAGVVSDSGVYNQKEIFTPNGNRRSFKQLHLPVTLDNIVKAMAAQNNGNTKNVSGFNGVKTLRAGTAERFKSIKNMHLNEGRLQNLTEEQAEALNDSLSERMYAIIRAIDEENGTHGERNGFIRYDNIGNILIEISEGGKYNVSDIQNVFSHYRRDISDAIAMDVKNLLYDISQMPVNFFEAKPERSVHFDEVRFAVVPDSMNSDVLNALSAAVPDVRVYPDGDEAARLEMLNSDESVRFQERDLSQISDRELLANAMESVAQNETERSYIKRYKKHIAELNEKQMAMEKAEQRIVELKAQDTKGNRDEILKLQNAVDIYSKQIRRADSRLLDYEATKPIKDMLNREKAEYKRKRDAASKERMARYREKQRERTQELIREVRETEANKRKAMRERADERLREAVQEQREIGQRKVDRLKESHGKEKYRAMILSDVKKLYGWVVSPTNKGHVPQFLRGPLAELIESIDLTSPQQLKGGDPTKNDRKFADALEKLRYAIGDINKQQSDIDGGAATFAGYIDLPADYMAEFDALVRKVKLFIEMGEGQAQTAFYRMTADQLHEMSKLFRILNSSIVKMNQLVANGRYESARTASNDTIADMNAMKAKTKTNKLLATLNTMFNWKNTTPYYAFQRLGRGGKAIFEGLQDGWDKMARNSAQLIEFAKSAFTSKQAKAWSKEIKTIELDSGESVQMTVSQIMSLYCLSKREQAVGHLKGGGIRVSDIDAGKGNTISQVDNYILSEADIDKIIGELTDEQIGVADKLQGFMNSVCTEWGNEISMKRFGYEMFTEKNYFPIETDANNRSRIDDKQDGNNSMFRLLNMSAMKQLTPNANNAIIVRDIFDVFSNHASDIGKYNALALPILDFIKWYNFVEKADVVDSNGKPTGQITTRSTQKALERAYGSDAKSYLMSFIKDLNAEHDGGRNDTFLAKMMGNAKAGSVNANMRVGFLQITSLPRAAYAISPKYLLAGMAKLKTLNPVNAIRGTEAQEEIGILQWKNLGFYSTDVARSTRSMVRRDDSIITKVRDLAMKPAEWGDNWVSNIIYEAAKAEMADKHKGLKAGTKAYDALLNKRVREIVYKTQVVDSTMTRSDFMRSKGLMTAFTAFMSEPTLTVNMLNEAIQEAVMNNRSGMGKADNLKSVGGKAVKAAATFAFTALASSLVESLFDAMRDDDDYEEFEEKFQAALGGNITDNVNILGMLPILKDIISIAQGYENNSMVTQIATQAMDVKKAIEGVQKGDRPIYSAIYNALKVVASGTGVGVQNVTRDGVALYNTFLADAWNTPKVQTYGDSKSDAASAYYAAVQEGDTSKAEWILRRAEANGITKEDFSTKVSTLTKEDYFGGKIDAATAESYLVQHAGKDGESASTTVGKWQYETETGLKHSEMKDDYIAGRITAEQATEYLMVYNGKTEQQAAEQIDRWDYAAVTGDSEGYSKYWEMYYAFENGGDFRRYAKEWINAGVDKSTIASSIAGRYKEEYLAIKGTAAGDRMLEHLLDLYEAIGYNRAYERKYITNKW